MRIRTHYRFPGMRNHARGDRILPAGAGRRGFAPRPSSLARRFDIPARDPDAYSARKTGREVQARAFLRILAQAGALALIVLILVGFSGGFFAPGDSAAVARPALGALLVLWAVVLFAMKASRLAVVSLAVAALAIGSLVPGYFAPERACKSGCLTVYQKNLLAVAWPRYSLADDIINSGAQVVTLEEVSDFNRHFMKNLFDHYTVAVTCRFRPNQDDALLTSLPVVPGSAFCLGRTGLAGVQLLAPDGKPLWVATVHLSWPYPFGQFRQSREIADRLSKLRGPVLIGGDFNMVPWGASVHRIAQAAGTRRLGPWRNSYRMGNWILPLPIDQVLVPEGASGTVERRPFLGSDHLGLLAHIALPS